MKIKALFGVMLITLTTLPNLSHSARWWQPDESDFSGSGLDLDSYRTFIDSEGYEISSMWFRAKLDKAQSLYNPKLGKNSITSAITMLVQIRCETGELKFTEFILQNRQFGELWKASEYPEYLGDYERGFNRFYYPSPMSRDYKLLNNLCKLREYEQKYDFSIKDLEIDEFGHISNNLF